MKICEKCGFENPDTYKTCGKCYALLGEKSEIVSTDEFFKKLDRKDKIKNIIDIAVMIIYALIYIPFFVLTYKKTDSAELVLYLLILLVLPLLVYYLSVFKADFMFKLHHTHIISDVDSVQPTSWYYTSNKIGGYLVLIIGIVGIIKIYTSLR